MIGSVRLALAFCAALLAGSAAAQTEAGFTPIPEKRVIYQENTDFFGGDIRAIFDTSSGLCERACRQEASCLAFTYNQNAGACFLKDSVGAQSPFAGALSARMVPAEPAVLSRAAARIGGLEGLPAYVVDTARDLALRVGWDHPDAGVGADQLRSLALAQISSAPRDALRSAFSAAALEDRAEDWLIAAEAALEAKRTGDAAGSAVNAYLRAVDPDLATNALLVLAGALEAGGDGRASIQVLRLALLMDPRETTLASLDRAIGLFGFRVTNSRIENNTASPRVCLTFSEPLRDKGFEYAPYLQLPAGDYAVQAAERDLCIIGAAHGATLDVTLRKGLPARTGEALNRSVDQSFYIRDREASVRFPGRAYVLARGPAPSLPVITVNTREVELALYEVEDRNLVPGLQRGLVGQPLRGFQAAEIPRSLGREIWRGTGETGLTLNEDVTTALPLADALSTAPAGVYVLTARVPAAEGGALATQWFISTDLGLAALEGSDGLHVYARSLASTAPIAGAKVALIGENNAVLATALSDQEGHAHFAPGFTRGRGGDAPAMVQVRHEETEDFAYLSLREAGFDLSDRGVEGRPAPPPVDVFAATDRGVYRPGERVSATILARDTRARALDGLPLTVIVSRADGVEWQRALVPEAGAGGRVFAFDLPEAAQRGGWRLAIHADTEAPALAEARFLVEDFVPERIDFTLDIAEARLALGARPNLAIAARYLYGAPGADLQIEGETRLTATHAIEAFPGYHFGPHDTAATPAFAAIEEGGQTDADGAASLTLPVATPAEALSPFTLEARIRLTDASRRPVERRITRPVFPDLPLIGIRPGFEGELPEGGAADFSLLAIGPDGEQIPLAGARWVLERIETRYQWYESGGRWRYDPVIRRSRVADGRIDLPATGTASLEAAVDWGEYQLTVSSEEAAFAVSSLTFNAGWYGASAGSDTPDRLDVALDKPRYQPGEAARLRYTAREAGDLFVAVMRDGVIETRRIAVAEGSGEVELTVTEAWHPGAYVTAALITPMEAAAASTPTARAPTRAPTRALGLAWATLEPGKARIPAAITSPAEARPRNRHEIVVQAEAAPGAEIWATVAATDLGILNLTAHGVPDPEGHYLGQRRLGVEIRDLYGRLIDGNAGTPGAIRSGGDGGAGGGLKSPPPTEALAAFFSGPLRVGADGTLRVPLDLPDFNGTLRVDAILWSAEGIGAATQDLQVRDPVVVSAAMPRFLAPGDQASLSLEFANVSGPDAPISVTVQSDGPLPLLAERQITVPPGGRESLTLQLRPEAAGIADILVTSELQTGETLTKSLTLAILRNDPPISRQSRFTLADGAEIPLGAEIFAGLDPATAHASFTAGPLARFDVPGLLTALDSYPYGCSEQITSRAFPLLAFRSTAAALGQSAAAIDGKLEESIATLLTRQRSDGSFALWGRGGARDLWLDAYITDFLSRARAGGAALPPRAFEAALRNLRNRVNRAPDFENAGQGLAYALYVLAREGEAAMGDLRYYADARATAFATPLARGQLGAALATYGDQKRADRLFRLAADMKKDDGGWRADYGSDTRDAAGLVSLAVEAGSDVLNLEALGTRVALASRLDGASSTQDKVWALRAAAALEGGAATTLLRDGEALAKPVLRLTAADLPTRLRQQGRETEAVLTTFGIPVEPVPAGGNGYRILRSYYTLDGVPLSPESLALGTRLVAVLEIWPERENEARLMVEDPLPAGLEAESPRLLQGGDVRALSWLDLRDVSRHTEFGTDRIRAAVDWRGAEPFRLAYILRAVSPGRFYQPAASIEDMYRPAYRARTGTGYVEIRE